jgi:16S rRNA (uracil1498-N3)-methyltransferase
VDDGERKLLSREYRPGEDTVILIGPEGDFSKEEIEMALAAGFVPVTLGDARLRTETAALTAIETFHIVSQVKG